MAVISKDLGAVTAYAAAVNRGYTGTKEEFETLMASYATVAEQAAESAQSASSSAQGASQAASSANAAMNNALTAESNAQSAASGAQGYAQSAQQSAQSASQSAQNAESAKNTAVNAVDGFAADAQQALDGVNQAGNNWKSLAQAQKLDAEAWAVGKRDGTDVGSSDETYHNNAKYYAESVRTSAQTATDAAQTATQKASDAQASASAAAESARTLTIDSTLTQAGQAADSKAVGDKINAITEATTISRTVSRTIDLSITWSNGYVNDNGQPNTNESFKHTQQIEVDAGDVIRLYDGSGNAIATAVYVTAYTSGAVDRSSGGYNVSLPYTVPNTIDHIVFSIRANTMTATATKTVYENALINKETPRVNALYDSVLNDSANRLIYKFNLTAGTPFDGADELQDICGYQIVFNAKISAFSGLVRIGKGEALTYGGAIAFDDTNIYTYINGNVTTPSRTQAHGLTLKDYIGLIIDLHYNGSCDVILSTNGGSYKWIVPFWRSQYGTITVNSTLVNLDDCVLSYACSAMNTDIWLYGDSYFSNTGVIRWTGYLVSNGYTNYLLNAYPGRNSLTALAALRKDLSFNKVPRKIVWCLGMNDADTNSSPNANWLSALNSVIAICDEYNIELILATCPIPTASGYDNTYKNEYVRNLGYRYIDFAMAVSAGGSNAWYDGMNDDGVHPTAQGALCLFNTAVAHVPELLS